MHLVPCMHSTIRVSPAGMSLRDESVGSLVESLVVLSVGLLEVGLLTAMVGLTPRDEELLTAA